MDGSDELVNVMSPLHSQLNNNTWVENFCYHYRVISCPPKKPLGDDESKAKAKSEAKKKKKSIKDEPPPWISGPKGNILLVLIYFTSFTYKIFFGCTTLRA